jgi:leucyl-tRNA synthetase
MNTYFPETRNGFEGVLAWLKQWACSRSYGLGSRIPWVSLSSALINARWPR